MEIVSFDLAKKLKEKGFPQHITDDAYIVDNYGEDEYDIGERLPIPLIPDYMDYVAAPTISQVFKWLREKNIHLYIDIDNEGWFFEIKCLKTRFMVNTDFLKRHSTYEQATLAGIEYVLDKLI